MPLNTYYFDTSDSGPTDAEGSWSNDANAFDNSTSTSASTTWWNTFDEENSLVGVGTDAPSSGGTISQVRARLYASHSASGDIKLEVEYSSTVLDDTNISFTGTAGWSSYSTLSTPSGGWTWAKVQALQARFQNRTSGTATVYSAEIEVTSILNTLSIDTDAPTSVAKTTLTANGDIISSDSSVTERGFVYDTTSYGNPGAVEIDSESFEVDLGVWVNDVSNVTDWARRTGAVPSAGSDTGPNGANDGSYYIYVETSTGSSNASGNTDIIEYSLPATGMVVDISFDYHQYGSNQGTLYLEAYDGATWNTIWSSTGDQGDQWNSASATSLDADSLRFRNVAAGGFRGDVALDAVVVNAIGAGVAPASTSYSDALTETGTYSTGTYSLGETGLTEDTTYYIRAYAENSDGYFYGPEVSVRTLADKYWVGGTGNWADTSSWSLTSGGTSGASVPSSLEDVFIDANSGFGAGGTITYLDGHACKDITSTSGHSYTLSQGGGGDLYIYGDLTLESGTTVASSSYLRMAGSAAATIDLGGGAIGTTDLIITGSGMKTLSSDLDSGIGFKYGEDAYFDANGYDVGTISQGWSTSSGGTGPGQTIELYMGEGTWYLGLEQYIDDSGGGTVNIYPQTATLQTLGSYCDFHIDATNSPVFDTFIWGATTDELYLNLPYTINTFTENLTDNYHAVLMGGTLTINTAITLLGESGNLTTIESQSDLFEYTGDGNNGRDVHQALYSGSTTLAGQSFAGVDGRITRARTYIRRTGSPTGNITAYIYAHSGTFGTSSVGTGSALATSTNTVDSSTVQTSEGASYNFYFSDYRIESGTNYVVVFEYTGGDVSNHVAVPYDNTSPQGDGNFTTYDGSWNAISGIISSLSLSARETHTITSAGTVSADYLEIYESNATGGATWLAGDNSVDGGGNTGWLFGTSVAQSSRFDNTNTFYNGTVVKEQFLTQTSRLENSNTFYAHIMYRQQFVSQGTRFDNSNTFYSGAVGRAQYIEGTLYTSTNTFYSGDVALYLVRDTLFENTSVFYTGTVVILLQSVGTPRLENTTTFFEGHITGKFEIDNTQSSGEFIEDTTSNNGEYIVDNSTSSGEFTKIQ